jgi:hypothetical protein
VTEPNANGKAQTRRQHPSEDGAATSDTHAGRQEAAADQIYFDGEAVQLRDGTLRRGTITEIYKTTSGNAELYEVHFPGTPTPGYWQRPICNSPTGSNPSPPDRELPAPPSGTRDPSASIADL